MVNNDSNGTSSDDKIRILVASDIHLGYLENDPVRGDDSFLAFEEVLASAVEYDVDFILLGGDLFDHAKPSPNCMFKCSQLIRKYCFGDKPVNIELLSDQLENFARNINYEDPNLNVSYPILSIHGNHDDPVGEGSISSLDILSITGLVNYFGKWNDYTHVRISPVLFQKGDTKLALYGLSHLKDQRLSRLFAEKKVEMEHVDDGRDWFNLLVLHQNRADRGPKNFISEQVLPKFLDLVVWGHEHDCQMFDIKREKEENDDFFVVQPGSTVATSLAAGEALKKHCALLQIHKKEFTLTPIPLKTIRPFIFKTVVLSEVDLGDGKVNESEKVQIFLKAKVEEAIEEAKGNLSGNPKQPTIPLVRLSVFYENENQNFNKIRFGQNFNGSVANPNDILLMKREKKIQERKEKPLGEGIEITGAAEAPDVETLIRSYYEQQPPESRLKVLSVNAMTEAVRDFTQKKNDDIFRKVLEGHKNACVEALLKSTAETDEDIEECMRQFKESLDTSDTDILKDLIAVKKAALLSPVVSVKQASFANMKRGSVVILSSDDEVDVKMEVEPSKGRGRGRGSRARGAGSGRGRGRPRASEPLPPSPTDRRTPRRAAAQKSAVFLQALSTKRSTRSMGSSDEDSD